MSWLLAATSRLGVVAGAAAAANVGVGPTVATPTGTVGKAVGAAAVAVVGAAALAAVGAAAGAAVGATPALEPGPQAATSAATAEPPPAAASSLKKERRSSPRCSNRLISVLVTST